MIEEHQKFVEQYNSKETVEEKWLKKTPILEVLVIEIVCSMTAIQKTVSVQLNIIAASVVTLLLVSHF